MVSKVRFQPNNTLPEVQKSKYNWRWCPCQDEGLRSTPAVFVHGRSTKKLWKVHSDVQRLVRAQWMVRQRASCRRNSRRSGPCLLGRQKAKLWQLPVPPSLVTKNPKTSCTAFNYHKRRRSNYKHLQKHFTAIEGVSYGENMSQPGKDKLNNKVGAKSTAIIVSTS